MEPVKFRNAKLMAGELIIEIPSDQRGSVMNWIKNRKNTDYSLVIKEYREKRSLDANAYCWVLIGKLAKVLRLSPLEVYREAIRNIGGNYEVLPVRNEAAAKFREAWESKGLGWICNDIGPSRIPGYTNHAAYYGSSSYDTEQMSRLIDNIIQDCKALGIETLPPEKLSAILEDWDAS